jgi:hypothetical protein
MATKEKKHSDVVYVEKRMKPLLKLSGTKIAEFLQKRKIKGLLGDSAECPLNRYFIQKRKELDISIEDSVVRVNTDFDGYVDVPMPVGMRNFVRMFDERKFKKLIAD